MIRTRLGLIAALSVASVLLALAIASTILASENPMSHDQYVRMSTAKNALWAGVWLMQVPIVWLGLAAFSPHRKTLQIGLSLLGSLIVSASCGLLLFSLGEHGWYTIAFHFK